MAAPHRNCLCHHRKTSNCRFGGWGNAVQGALGGLDALPQNGLVAQTALLDSAAQNADGVREECGRAPARVNGGLVSVGGVPAAVGSSATQALKSLGGTKESGVMQSLQAVAAQMPGPEHHSAAVSSQDGMRLLGQGQAMSIFRWQQWCRVSRSLVGAPWRKAAIAAVLRRLVSVDRGSMQIPRSLAGRYWSCCSRSRHDRYRGGVAEQVAFWVRQNIQNAEMTIQHEGQAVEVSVSLTGNEAHVAFGSDQAETRSPFDGSVAQLREMLRQEGLSLSGVTVASPVSDRGPNSRDAAMNRVHRERLSWKCRCAIARAGPVLAQVQQTDRSVDIFV